MNDAVAKDSTVIVAMGIALWCTACVMSGSLVGEAGQVARILVGGVSCTIAAFWMLYSLIGYTSQTSNNNKLVMSGREIVMNNVVRHKASAARDTARAESREQIIALRLNRECVVNAGNMNAAIAKLQLARSVS